VVFVALYVFVINIELTFFESSGLHQTRAFSLVFLLTLVLNNVIISCFA
jgi:hypothetical protein